MTHFDLFPQKLNAFEKKTNIMRRWMPRESPLAVRRNRTSISGPHSAVAVPRAEEACRPGHAHVNPAGSVEGRLLRSERVYRRHVLVTFPTLQPLLSKAQNKGALRLTP